MLFLLASDNKDLSQEQRRNRCLQTWAQVKAAQKSEL
jgi:hypothetical protein